MKLHIKLGLLIGILVICSTRLIGQENRYSISGYVSDIDTKEPLPGAEIYIHELALGTVTDVNGFFRFEKLKPARYNLHVKYIGYHSTFHYINLNRNIENEKIEIKASYLELMEVVVESDPFKTGPVEKSLTVQTISDEFILKNPGGTLVNSLEKLPGINAINTGVGIAKPVIRGLSFNRVIVSDKGIKQEDQQWGADHGLEIDQYSPEQVEILKGPASLQYGSDGLGGILIINPPSLPEEGKIEGQILANYKSNNNLFGASGMVKGNFNGVIYQLRLSMQDFGDYMVPADSFTYNGYILPIFNNQLKNTAGLERDMAGMLGIKKNWGFSTLSISNVYQKSGLFPGAIGIPREYNLNDDGDPRNIDLPRQLVNHFKVISNSNILIGENWLEADLGYQHNDRREEGAPHAHGYEPSVDGNLALGLNLNTYTANIKYNQAISHSVRRIFGIQIQHQANSFSGYEFLMPEYTSNDAGIFIHEQRSFGETMAVNGGVRFDYGNRNISEHYEPDYSTPDQTDSLLRNQFIDNNYYNGSGALGFSYFPSHEINLKANIGTSFRIPSPSELSVNGVHHGTFRHEKGDPDLKSERGWQVDINATYHEKKFYVSVSPYFNYFHQYIYLKPTAEFSTLPGGGQIFQYTQNNAIYWGFETSLDYHLMEDLHMEVNLEYVWNYNLDTYLPLPFTPPFSALIEMEYKIPGVSGLFTNTFFNAGTRLSASQNRVDRNENATPGYTLFYLGIGTDFKLGNQKIELLCSVLNIFNTKFMNHLSRYRWLNLPEQGRNVNFTIIFPFKSK